MPDGVVEIRRATLADAGAISAIVLRCLREINAQYYAADTMANVLENFSPAKIAERMADRVVLVACVEGAIIGTASLHGAWVRGVFVRPDRQERGIGARLMQAIEKLADAQGIGQLSVPSSINAEGFYRRLGFTHLRDEYQGQERVIVMMKLLTSAAEQG